jgi:TPR repeat protein
MEQAAAQGDTQAQVNLGMLYYQGRGVPGLREGSTALREAAAQGV